MTKGQAIYNLIKIQGESIRRTRFTDVEIKKVDKSLKVLDLPIDEEIQIRRLMEL